MKLLKESKLYHNSEVVFDIPHGLIPDMISISTCRHFTQGKTIKIIINVINVFLCQIIFHIILLWGLPLLSSSSLSSDKLMSRRDKGNETLTEWQSVTWFMMIIGRRVLSVLLDNKLLRKLISQVVCCNENCLPAR